MEAKPYDWDRGSIGIGYGIWRIQAAKHCLLEHRAGHEHMVFRCTIRPLLSIGEELEELCTVTFSCEMR
jgi:hypothetical protein